MKPLPVYFMLVLMISACEKNIVDLPTEPVPLVLPEKTASVIESDNTFGFNIFKEVIENDDAENIFISPTSIALALAMTYNGAEGDTKLAFETALNKQGLTREEINKSYKSLIAALQSVDPRVILEIANSIWYDEKLNVLQSFKDVNTEYYNALVNPLNFDNPVSAGIINTWVNDNTNGLIEKIIEEIPDGVVMYLINAIYFKGMWKYEFEKSSTSEEKFYLETGGTVNNDFMNQEADLAYMNSEKFAMAELPYGQGNYSMVVLLPNPGFTTDDIVGELTLENWESWISLLTVREVGISLPKLKFSYKNELKNELSALGLGIAFTGSADFSGIDGARDLFISRVIHKSFVDINEEGTEAAAVTAVEMEFTSVGSGPIPFIVNKPYIFALRETTTGAILFMGRVKNPTILENGRLE